MEIANQEMQVPIVRYRLDRWSLNFIRMIGFLISISNKSDEAIKLIKSFKRLFFFLSVFLSNQNPIKFHQMTHDLSKNNIIIN